MKNFAKSLVSALIAAAPFLLSPGSSLSAQNTSPLTLSEEVHTAGQVAYERACAGCHLVNLLGSFEAANGTLMFGWTTALIFAFVQHLYLQLRGERHPGE